MPGIVASFRKATSRSGRILAAAAVIGVLPVAAHATVIATFDWVPISDNPTSTQKDNASGTLQLTLASFTQINPGNPTTSYYTSGAAETATVTGFSYTGGDGQTINLSNLTSTTLASSVWATSATDTPAAGTTAPTAPTAGDYLTTAFTFTGRSVQGASFMIGNAAGTAGSTLATGIGNGGNSFGGITTGGTTYGAINDGGYWELASVTPVPVPPALPLLLCGVGVFFWAKRRGEPLLAA